MRAEKLRGITAPVKEEDDLLAIVEASRDLLLEPRGEQLALACFGGLYRHIDKLNQRHLTIVDSLLHLNELVLSKFAVVI